MSTFLQVEQATPSVPAATQHLSYFKADGFLYTLNSAGQERKIVDSTNGLDAAQVTYTAAGVGAVATTSKLKLDQWATIKDFGGVGDGITSNTTAMANAITAITTPNGTVLFPNATIDGVNAATGDSWVGTLPATYAGTLEYLSRTGVNLFGDPNTAAGIAERLTTCGMHSIRGQGNGSHASYINSLYSLSFNPVGSGAAGPTASDDTLLVSNIKQGYLAGTTVQGEINGIYVVVRQGGAVGGGSDSAGILVDNAVVGTAGYCASMETQASLLTVVTGAVTKGIQTQIGVIDGVNAVYNGFFARADVGALTDAYRCDTNGGTWTNFLHFMAAGVNRFSMDNTGKMTWGTDTFLQRSAAATFLMPATGATLNLGNVAVAGSPGFNFFSSGLAAGGDGYIYCSGGTASADTGTIHFGSAIVVMDGGTNLTLAPGTTTLSPLIYTSGTNMTTPTAGVTEFDGVNYYKTIDTTSGRAAVPIRQHFRLTVDSGTVGPAIANFFGATSNIPLVANAYYEIEIVCYFLKTTTEILTWTFTNSAAPTSQNIAWEQSPITGIVAPPGTATLLSGQFRGDATAARTVAAGSLTTAVDHYMKCRIWLKNGTGTSLKIQVTSPAGTVTPRLGSYWTCTRIATGNTGTFAA
jgi:hypothetical protein